MRPSVRFEPTGKKTADAGEFCLFIKSLPPSSPPLQHHDGHIVFLMRIAGVILHRADQPVDQLLCRQADSRGHSLLTAAICSMYHSRPCISFL